jgi:diphthine synthase
MSCSVAIDQLLLLLEKSPDRSTQLPPNSTLAIAASQVGSSQQRLVSGTLSELKGVDVGGPLHSLVIVGKRFHPLERDFAGRWAMNSHNWEAVAKGAYGCA